MDWLYMVFIYNPWVWFQFHYELFSSSCMTFAVLSQPDEQFSTEGHFFLVY